MAAESFGLGAVMVGAMRKHSSAVAELLELPDEVFVVYGMSIGWPDGDPREHGLKPRLPADLVVHRDTYSDAGAADAIAAYNADLAAFYESQGRNLDSDAAWTGPVARGSQNLRYATLRDELDARGFSFD